MYYLDRVHNLIKSHDLSFTGWECSVLFRWLELRVEIGVMIELGSLAGSLVEGIPTDYAVTTPRDVIKLAPPCPFEFVGAVRTRMPPGRRHRGLLSVGSP